MAKKSVPGAVGNDMAAALKGAQDGYISANYMGRPANAIPFVPPPNAHPPPNVMTVADWTQRNMQERRSYKKGGDNMWGNNSSGGYHQSSNPSKWNDNY